MALKMTVLSGIIASQGKYKGTAKIVTTFKDISIIKEGDIVVTNNNSPLFSVAFMNASAIISECGGALCHLAIISREMQKPCILCVENATSLLKNGMIIEIDAFKNKITILENG